MSYVCPICAVKPLSHSLTKVLENDDMVYLYTCPSQAILYDDVSGIINHYDGVLSEIPEDKEWVWIFDSVKFGIVHAVQTTSVAIEIAKLITRKFSNNLKRIVIINPTFYITVIHDLLLPFLNKKVKSIIEIKSNPMSFEEVIMT